MRVAVVLVLLWWARAQEVQELRRHVRTVLTKTKLSDISVDDRRAAVCPASPQNDTLSEDCSLLWALGKDLRDAADVHLQLLRELDQLRKKPPQPSPVYWGKRPAVNRRSAPVRKPVTIHHQRSRAQQEGNALASLQEENLCADPALSSARAIFSAGGECYQFDKDTRGYLEVQGALTLYHHDFALFSFRFKTDRQDGLLLYRPSPPDCDRCFIALYLSKSQLVHVFDYGDSRNETRTRWRGLSDNQWHWVQLKHSQHGAGLFVDNTYTGWTTMNPQWFYQPTAPLYLGGIPKNLKTHLPNMPPFVGTLWDFNSSREGSEGRQSDSKSAMQVTAEGVILCNEVFEPGAFMFSGNGHLKLDQHVDLHADIILSLKVKPRTENGGILTVGPLQLYLLKGALRFGMHRTEVVLSRPLIDNNWHHIQMYKVQNVLLVSADGVASEPVRILPSSVPAVSYRRGTTRHAIVLGGDERSRQGFDGCLKDLHIRYQPVDLHRATKHGDVRMGVCKARLS